MVCNPRDDMPAMNCMTIITMAYMPVNRIQTDFHQ